MVEVVIVNTEIAAGNSECREAHPPLAPLSGRVDRRARNITPADRLAARRDDCTRSLPGPDLDPLAPVRAPARSYQQRRIGI
jgi:hypothetical protein